MSHSGTNQSSRANSSIVWMKIRMGSIGTRVTELLAVLSRPGMLAILEQAEGGIKPRTGRNRQVGLTRKQYHTGLLQLVRIGLIEKVDGSYKQTKFGELVWHRYLPRLETAFRSQ